MQAAFKKISAVHGRPAILVNNAGISAVIPFAQMEPAEMERHGPHERDGAALLHARGAGFHAGGTARRDRERRIDRGALRDPAHVGLLGHQVGRDGPLGVARTRSCRARGSTSAWSAPPSSRHRWSQREEKRTGLSIPELLTLRPETVSKAVLEVIRKERDIVVVPRALGTVAALRPTIGPVVRWVARESTSLLKPRLRPPGCEEANEGTKPRKR